MPTRRRVAGAIALLLPAVLAGRDARAAAADPALDDAAALIREAGNRLAPLVRAGGTAAERQGRLGAFLDEVVDIEGVARFCLGRFWRAATPSQQHDYTALFRAVLVRSVGARIGDYPQGEVRVTTLRAVRRGDLIEVPTLVERLRNAAAHVTWVVGLGTGRPRIADIVAEGVSLRLTQRSDIAAFLSRNGNDLDLLLQALRRQEAAPA